MKVTDSNSKDTPIGKQKRKHEWDSKLVNRESFWIREGKTDRMLETVGKHRQACVCLSFWLSINKALLAPLLLLGNAICLIYCACLFKIDSSCPGEKGWKLNLAKHDSVPTTVIWSHFHLHNHSCQTNVIIRHLNRFLSICHSAIAGLLPNHVSIVYWPHLSNLGM